MDESDDFEVVLQNSPLSDYLVSQDIISQDNSVDINRPVDHNISSLNRPSSDLGAGQTACDENRSAKTSFFPSFSFLGAVEAIQRFVPLKSQRERMKLKNSQGIIDEILASEELCDSEKLRLREIRSVIVLGSHEVGGALRFLFLLALCLPVPFIAVPALVKVGLCLCAAAVLLVPGILYCLDVYGLSRLRSRAVSFLFWSHHLNGTVKSAVGVVREREVLSRGFFVASKHTTVEASETNFARKTSSGYAQCRSLREALAGSGESLIKDLAQETAKLLKHLSLEIQSQSLLKMNLDEISRAISEDVKRGETAIETIKILWQFLHILRSEYLGFSCEALASPDYCAEDVFSASLVEDMKQASQKMQSLTALYDYRNEKTEIKKTSVSAKVTHFRQLAAHSLCLHLQHALQVAVEAEKNLIGNAGSPNENSDLNAEIADSLNKAKSCLSELDLNTQSASAPEIDLPGTKNAYNWRNKEDTSGPVVIISEEFHPRIVDQVFEARTDTEESTTSESITALDPDDKGLQKAASRKVLEELKSVLSVRSETMKLRELRALADFRGITLEELRAEEEESLEPSFSEHEATELDESERSRVNNEDRAPLILPTEDFAAQIALRAEAFGRKEESAEICFGDSEAEGSDVESY